MGTTLARGQTQRAAVLELTGFDALQAKTPRAVSALARYRKGDNKAPTARVPLLGAGRAHGQLSLSSVCT